MIHVWEDQYYFSKKRLLVSVKIKGKVN
jgi:hypothetical protein